MKALSTPAHPAHSFRILGLSLKAIAFVALAVITVITAVWLQWQKESVKPTAASSAPKIDYAALVKQRVGAAAAKDEETLQRFNEALGGVMSRYDVRFASVADAVAAKTAEYSSILPLIYYIAWDQVNNEQHADVFLKEQIEPLMTPALSAFTREVTGEFQKLDYELRKNSTQLAVDLAALSPATTTMSPRVVADAEIEGEFKKAMRNLGIDAAQAAVFLPLDVYGLAQLRAVPALLKRLIAVTSRVFAKQAARVVATMVLMGVPIPITEIIAVFSGIWTVYDISQIQPEFRNEMRTVTLNKLMEVRGATKDRVSAFAGERVALHVKLQAQIGAKSEEALTAGEAK